MSEIAQELSEEIIEVVRTSAIAALLLEVPSKKILAASASARSLLAPDGREILGHHTEEYLADRSSGGLELMLAGRLDGYEALRQLGPDEERAVPLRLWMRRVGDAAPPRYAIAVVALEGQQAGRAPGLAHSAKPRRRPVVGACDRDLLIDRISRDVEPLLGVASEEAIGRSILHLVAPSDLPKLLFGLAQIAASRSGVTLTASLISTAGTLVLCQLALVPLDPAPSFAFVMFEGVLPGRSLTSAPDMELALWHVAQSIDTLTISRDLAGAVREQLPGLTKLSSRELDIVTRLVAGDRVPAIATALFVSQSTVRNHLSSIFTKLGVRSQQELISLIRSSAQG
jgi:DNA-binding CsgD family transcriptional regulator